MRPAIFLDRDGVLCEEKGYITSLDQLNIFPYTAECVRHIHEKGFLAICITNQSAVARGMISESNLVQMNQYLIEKIGLDDLYYCPHHPKGIGPYRCICDCRKPQIGLIKRAVKQYDIDLSQSYMVGDRASDILCGERAQIQTVLLESGYGTRRLEQPVTPDMVFENLYDFVQRFMHLDKNETKNIRREY